MPIDKTRPILSGGQLYSPFDLGEPAAPQGPGFLDAVGPAFRTENLIGSFAASEESDLSGAELRRVEEGYSPYDGDELVGYEEHHDKFLDAHNPTVTAAIKADIDREKRDQDTIEAAGWSGAAAGILSSVASPTSVLPGGALVRVGKVGYSVGRSALAVGAAAGGAAVIDESVLQATQQTRSMQDSLMAVGGSFVLGGIIGGAGARILGASEFGRISKQLEGELQEGVPNASDIDRAMVHELRSAGASAAQTSNPEDTVIGGSRTVKAIAAATAAVRLNPGITVLQATSPRAREIGVKLFENHVGTAGELDGRPIGPAVETNMQYWRRGVLATTLEEDKTFFKAARNDGWKGTRKDFNAAVSAASRRNDIDPNANPHVTAAAKAKRERVFEPMKEEAVKVGLLPQNVKVTTAPSYLHRMFNRKQIIGQEAEFRAAVRPWVNDMVERARAKQEEIGIARDIVRSDDLGEKLSGAFDRLGRVQGRLDERKLSRGRKLDLIRKAEGERFELLRGRVPEYVIEAAKAARDDDVMVRAVAEASTTVKQTRKKPIIGLLKDRGGVRIGSPLDDELRHMGVTPKSAPGLFKKEGGLSAVDNFVASEDLFLARMHVDENGYAEPGEILAAIRDEMAGAPLKMEDDAAFEAALDVLGRNVDEWLGTIGLDSGATAKEVRDHLDSALRNEGKLGELDQKIGQMHGELEDFDRFTDQISNERLIAEAEANRFQDELNLLDAKINAVREYANASPRVKLLVDFADARKGFAKNRYDQTKAANRIEAIERVSSEGRATPELEAELRALRTDKNAIDEKVIKSKHRVEKLKPMLPKDKGDVLDFIDDDDLVSHVEGIVDSIFENVTGRGNSDVPDWIVPIATGPLKGRTFDIPDELIERFLENDIEVITRQYIKKMSAEIELARAFGRADMQDQVAEIKADYNRLRSRAMGEKELNKLTDEEGRVLSNIEAFRDILRGTYLTGNEGTGWSVATRMALSWNFITKLGGVALSSLPDAFGVMTKNGLNSFMQDGIGPLVSSTKAARIAKRDSFELGAVTETSLQSRLAAAADLGDPYASGSIPERLMDAATNMFAKATFLDRWNDFLKQVVSLQTQQRVARLLLDNLVDVKAGGQVTGKQVSYEGLSKWDKGYLGKLEIDEGMASRIADQVQRFGFKEKGIWGLNVSKWDDAAARRAIAAALNKEVDGTVVTPGVADKPLWTRTNTGKVVMQFKSFGLSAHQRVLMSRLQGRQRHLAEFVLFGTLGGMMVSYLKLLERGDYEGVERLTENPGLWIADGFDRTGIATVLMDVSNTAEKIGAPFGIKSAAQAIAGDEDRSAGVSRFANRNTIGAIFGPSVGAIQDMATIATQAASGEVNKQGAGAMLRNVPGGTLPGVRSLLQTQVKPALINAVD
ncbi:hypothetical protein [Roseibium algae]|uniref:Uncharacterized protein n=1 Tax=Roseibium algae TaxID=3123038 RepID=A0ABU8TK98_9HYPH